MKLSKLITLPFFAVALCTVGNAAPVSSITWNFDLPATSSFSPPYPSLGTLTLENRPGGGGVRFTLDPNESNPGYANNSTIDGVNFIFQDPLGQNGTALTASQVSGPTLKSFTYGNNSNMDSGYVSAAQQLAIRYDNSNNQGKVEFSVLNPELISVFDVLGDISVNDFLITADHNANNPKPIYAILSTSKFSLPDEQSTPSSWVAAVPEPSIFGFAGLSLFGFGLTRRKHNR